MKEVGPTKSVEERKVKFDHCISISSLVTGRKNQHPFTNGASFIAINFFSTARPYHTVSLWYLKIYCICSATSQLLIPFIACLATSHFNSGEGCICKGHKTRNAAVKGSAEFKVVILS